MSEFLCALEGAVFATDRSKNRFVSFPPDTSIPQVHDQLQPGDVKVILKQQRHTSILDSRGNPITYSAPPEYGMLYVNPTLLTPRMLKEEGGEAIHPVDLYVRAQDGQVYPLFPQDHIIFVGKKS